MLQELVVNHARWIKHVNIVAPMLTQLTLSLHTYQEVSISILAPMVEKVSWHCRYGIDLVGSDLWQLETVRLHKDKRQGHETELAFLQIYAYIVRIFYSYLDKLLRLQIKLIFKE
jgi:hypothetical protein